MIAQLRGLPPLAELTERLKWVKAEVGPKKAAHFHRPPGYDLAICCFAACAFGDGEFGS